jgi:fluoride exporter
MHINLTHLLWATLGGAIGSGLRFCLNNFSPKNNYWITAGINILGSFALGVICVYLFRNQKAYALAGIGICGGFTTFSTFSKEALELLQKNQLLGIIYIIASVLCSILAFYIAQKLFSS